MTTFDAKFDFRFSCAPGATIDTKIKSLGGDGGYIVGPLHILNKKVGHLPGIIVASGGNYKVPTRVLDSVALRALVPDPALRAKFDSIESNDDGVILQTCRKVSKWSSHDEVCTPRRCEGTYNRHDIRYPP